MIEKNKIKYVVTQSRVISAGKSKNSHAYSEIIEKLQRASAIHPPARSRERVTDDFPFRRHYSYRKIGERRAGLLRRWTVSAYTGARRLD